MSGMTDERLAGIRARAERLDQPGTTIRDLLAEIDRLRALLAAEPGDAAVDRIARVMLAAWEHAEGEPVSASYVATFADMARAVLTAAKEASR